MKRRHVDGVWRSADEVPRTADGRPISYVALHGHGSYPVTGRIIRLFGAFNDYTSARGKSEPPVWTGRSSGLYDPSTPAN